MFNVSSLLYSQTNISLSVDGAQAPELSIVIYTVTGQRVRTLSALLRPGANRLMWDGRDDRGNSVASGVYVYRLEGVSRPQFGKMLLLR